MSKRERRDLKLELNPSESPRSSEHQDTGYMRSVEVGGRNLVEKLVHGVEDDEDDASSDTSNVDISDEKRFLAEKLGYSLHSTARPTIPWCLIVVATALCVIFTCLMLAEWQAARTWEGLHQFTDSVASSAANVCRGVTHVIDSKIAFAERQFDIVETWTGSLNTDVPKFKAGIPDLLPHMNAIVSMTTMHVAGAVDPYLQSYLKQFNDTLTQMESTLHEGAIRMQELDRVVTYYAEAWETNYTHELSHWTHVLRRRLMLIARLITKRLGAFVLHAALEGSQMLPVLFNTGQQVFEQVIGLPMPAEAGFPVPGQGFTFGGFECILPSNDSMKAVDVSGILNPDVSGILNPEQQTFLRNGVNESNVRAQADKAGHKLAATITKRSDEIIDAWILNLTQFLQGNLNLSQKVSAALEVLHEKTEFIVQLDANISEALHSFQWVIASRDQVSYPQIASAQAQEQERELRRNALRAIQHTVELTLDQIQKMASPLMSPVTSALDMVHGALVSLSSIREPLHATAAFIDEVPTQDINPMVDTWKNTLLPISIKLSLFGFIVSGLTLLFCYYLTVWELNEEQLARRTADEQFMRYLAAFHPRVNEQDITATEQVFRPFQREYYRLKLLVKYEPKMSCGAAAIVILLFLAALVSSGCAMTGFAMALSAQKVHGVCDDPDMFLFEDEALCSQVFKDLSDVLFGAHLLPGNTESCYEAGILVCPAVAQPLVILFHIIWILNLSAFIGFVIALGDIPDRVREPFKALLDSTMETSTF